MARLIQAVLSFFSGLQGQGESRNGNGAAIATSETAAGADAPDLSLEVTRLHAWLMGCRGIEQSEHSIPERAMLTELQHRIRDRRLS